MNAQTEQNSTHTPGPWDVVALNGFGPYAIRMPTPAGSKHPTHYGVGQIGTEANARLIAAAPELLRVAERMAHAASMDPGQDRLAAFQIVAEEARAAIAKAVQS